MQTDNKYFESKEFKELFNKYQKSVENNENVYFEPEEWTDIAEYLYMLGNIDMAVETLDKAINIFPGAVAPLCYRARYSMHYENDGEKASNFLKQVSDKTDLEYIYTSAELMIWHGNAKDADKYLEDEYANTYDDEKEDFAIDTASLFSEYEQNKLAHKWLERSSDTENLNYKEVQAQLALSEGKLEESERLYNELIDTDPYSITYWNQLAASQFMRNDLSKSIESSEFSLAINPEDEEAILNKANGLFMLENYSEALKYYHRFNSLYPDNPSSILFEGICVLYENKLEQGVELLKKAEVLYGDNQDNFYELYKELSLALSRMGKLDEALQYNDKMKTVSTGKDADILVQRGHVLLENQHIDDAARVFNDALQITDDVEETIVSIAVSAYDNGYISKAYDLLSSLYKYNNSNMKNGVAYLALCCKYMNKDKDYRKLVKQVCTTNPAEAKYVLGEYFPKGMEPSDYYDFLCNSQ